MQVWSWGGLQRRYDCLMNIAYINAAKRLVEKAFSNHTKINEVLDVGSGSGIVLRFLREHEELFSKYIAFDLSAEGINLLKRRIKKYGFEERCEVDIGNICEENKKFLNRFDRVISNFCLYTISNRNQRIVAIKNISKYLKRDGKYYISLPSPNYSAHAIAKQCLIDESNADYPVVIKFLRKTFLVPYQQTRVVLPIEEKIKQGEFVKFSELQIREEFSEAGLLIESISLDYGGCGFHVSGSKASS